jgi:hypothetical protein
VDVSLCECGGGVGVGGGFGGGGAALTKKNPSMREEDVISFSLNDKCSKNGIV